MILNGLKDENTLDQFIHFYDNSNRTPLQSALMTNNIDIAKLLIEHGATVPVSPNLESQSDSHDNGNKDDFSDTYDCDATNVTLKKNKVWPCI